MIDSMSREPLRNEFVRKLLLEGASELGLNLSDEQVSQCCIYLEELKKWNRRINLTAITDEQDAIVKHFLDSFSFVNGLCPQPDLRLLDLGSGAGFPALPIKIAFPQISVAMVESVKKKASFLRHMVRTLKLLSVEVLDTRAEVLSESLFEQYDVITARAFASMLRVIELGSRFVKRGGHIVMSRGPEETLSNDVIAGTGLVLHERREFVLPFSHYRRTIWVFRKDANVPRGTVCADSPEQGSR
jgi:16S rRNA (guanine527-N7)-methyltransferase